MPSPVFGVSGARRAGFKSPSLHLGAKHFTVSPLSASPGTVYTADLIGTQQGFSDFTCATSPNGPFGASIDYGDVGSYTAYLRASTPYPLTLPVAITIA